MSDYPPAPRPPDTSHQADLETSRAATAGHRRMATALVSGRSTSWAQRRRQWPLLLVGALATALVAAALGIANAYQDQKAVDQRDAVPTAPAEPSAAPASPPSSTPTKQSTASPKTRRPQRRSGAKQPTTTKQKSTSGAKPGTIRADTDPTAAPSGGSGLR